LDKTSLNNSELCGSSGEQKTESLFFFQNKFISYLGAAELFQLKNFTFKHLLTNFNQKLESEDIF